MIGNQSLASTLEGGWCDRGHNSVNLVGTLRNFLKLESFCVNINQLLNNIDQESPNFYIREN